MQHKFFLEVLVLFLLFFHQIQRFLFCAVLLQLIHTSELLLLCLLFEIYLMFSHTIFQKILHHVFLLEPLEKLHENNLNLAVVSNKTIEFTRPIVEHFHMDKYFDVILGGDSLDNKKPHHEPLEHVINHYNSDKNETIIVGDTEKDIAAATNAGIASCGVTYGMRNPEDIKAMKPDFVIDKFDEIRDVLTL